MVKSSENEGETAMANENVLLFEIGNTAVHYAVCPEGTFQQNGKILIDGGLGDALNALLDGLTRRFGLAAPKILVSSVRKAGLDALWDALEAHRLPAPLVVSPIVIKAYAERTGLSFPNYGFLGGDLFCDAIALKTNPVIVVDAGTALKVIGLNAKGIFVGGAIAPGLGLMRESLYQGTDEAKANDLFLPKDILSLSTEGAISSGIVYGAASMVLGLIGKARESQGLNDAKVVVTGGDCRLLADGLSRMGLTDFAVDPLLTLKGLATAFGREGLFGGK